MRPTPKRRWFQFSLRWLLVVMTALCCGLGAIWHFEIAPAERQRVAVQVVHRLGGKAGYGSSPDDGYWPLRPLRRWLPRDYFDAVTLIELDNTPAGDDDLAQLRGLNKLQILYLRNTQVTDAGLVHLRKLRSLYELDLGATKVTGPGLAQLREPLSLSGLYLDETAVTDAGLTYLNGQPNLQVLSLNKTSVTDAGLVRLSRFPRLSSLHLYDTKVTDAGIATLRESSRQHREYVIIHGMAKPFGGE